MKIAICGSMFFAESMLEAKKTLEANGHTVSVPRFIAMYNGKDRAEREAMSAANKIERDAIRCHWEEIKKSDAILVLNHEKNGVEGYVGGNTLMEMGFAHVLGKKIFMLNPIPDMPYRDEMEGVKPTVINGKLELV